MGIFNRKSHVQRIIEKVNDSLDAATGITSSLPGAAGSGKALNAAMPKSLPKGQAAKAGLIAGGLLGLTATSAGISSLRRRREGARDDS